MDAKILFSHCEKCDPNRNVDLREYLTEEAQATEKITTYDLVANVVHDGKPTEGSYRIHVLHHVSGFIFLCWKYASIIIGS